MALFRKAQDIVSQKLKKSATLAETQSIILDCFLDKFDPLRKADRVRKKAKKPQAVQKTIESQTDRSRERSNFKKSRIQLKACVLHTVNQRDRGCCQTKLPDGSVCGHSHWIHFHHNVSIANGGTDSVENLVTLCSSHHQLWHKNSV